MFLLQQLLLFLFPAFSSDVRHDMLVLARWRLDHQQPKVRDRHLRLVRRLSAQWDAVPCDDFLPLELQPLVLLFAFGDPLADELSSFPSPSVAKHNFAFAIAHRTWLQSWDVHDERVREYRDAWLSVANAREDAWQRLVDAQNSSSCVRDRIDALEMLQETLGCDSFRDGRMPFPAPLERFWKLQ